MEELKKIWNRLKSPSAIFAALYSLCAAVIIASTIVQLVFGNTNNIIGYVMYGVSAIVLTYWVYIFIIFIPKMKAGVVGLLKKNKFTNELLESYGYRSVIFASFSFIFNVLYAITQAVFAIIAGSIWYGALATYYILISLIRGGLVAISRKRNVSEENFTLHNQIKSYRNCGAYIVALNFVLVAAIVQMVIDNQGFKYAGIMIYVMAAYAFYKLGMGIYNLFKAKKHNDYTIQSIKNLSFADALVSILALQTALLQAFITEGSPRVFNTITGALVSVIIIGLGVYMVVKGQKDLKKLKEGKLNGQV